MFKIPIGGISDSHRRQVGGNTYATPSPNVVYFRLVNNVSTVITPDYPPMLVRYWTDIGSITIRYRINNATITGPSPENYIRTN